LSWEEACLLAEAFDYDFGSSELFEKLERRALEEDGIEKLSEKRLLLFVRGFILTQKGS
jgi:hypothetical protein